MAQGQDAWTELERRRLQGYGIFEVEERVSRGPHGKDGRFVVVGAPDWAVVIPALERDGRRQLVTVRQFRHGSGLPSAEFPGGVVEPGEPPEAAAARELAEETAYRAGRIVKLGSCSPNPAFMANTLHIFLAEELTPLPSQSLDEHELVDVQLEDEAAVLAGLGDPPWSHALMATAAWYYARYRGYSLRS